MKIKYRTLTKAIRRAIRTFPAVVVTGPRQSGKTTLLKSIFGGRYDYLNLENPDVRMRAKDDPIGFLGQFKPFLIIDEVQYVPELLSYIKTRIDEQRRPGQYILSGSQNFLLMQGVSQSLAGRAAIFSLLPFSYAERIDLGENTLDIASLLRKVSAKQFKNKGHDISEMILRGNYPEIASNKRVDRQIWCGSYISTFLERDIRNLAHVGDLGLFERFLRMCAVRTGQILNISDIARDIGVSVTTAKRWLSLLETGYQIFLLYPYYKNIGKRLVKSPKIYFNDTALSTYLLGLNDRKTLLDSPYFPHLFETFVIIDFLKRFLNFGQMPSMYYLRTRDKMEVDLALEIGQKVHLFEIKSSATITPNHAASLLRAASDLRTIVESASLISCSENSFLLKNRINNYRWHDVLSL